MKSILPGFILFSFLLSIFITNPLQAATESRLALIIGNGDYAFARLTNPVNDATDTAAALQRLGFTVVLKKNAGYRVMEEAIREFGNRLKRGGVGLFYFAGHGMQIGGVNYLIPVGARIDKETDVQFEAINAERVLAEMANAENGLNIVILDACRDNPFSRSFRSAGRGLAIISNAPSGTFISYSTGPNQVARDGEGRNSPYTTALLKYMKEPGLPIEDVFKKVRQNLRQTTGGKQVPWELSSLEGRFYFNPRQGSKIAEEKEAHVDKKPLTQQARKTITIPARNFMRSHNIEVGVLPFGEDIIHNAQPYGHAVNWAEYSFEAEGGLYELWVEYAAAEPRPIVITVNSQTVNHEGLADTTGGWYLPNQRIVFQNNVTLHGGNNTVRLYRDDYFPHIRTIQFRPKD